MFRVNQVAWIFCFCFAKWRGMSWFKYSSHNLQKIWNISGLQEGWKRRSFCKSSVSDQKRLGTLYAEKLLLMYNQMKNTKYPFDILNDFIYFSEYVCNQQFARTNDAQDSTDLILGPTRLTKRKCKDKCLKMRNCNSIQLCCPENHKTCEQYECSLFKENSRKTKNNTVDIPGNCFVNSRNCDFSKKTIIDFKEQ